SSFMARLSRMRLLAPIPSFGIVMRLLVKRRLVGGLCVFAVRLRCPFLLANLLARRVFHRLDADIVFLVGTPDLDGKRFRGTGGNFEFGGGVHEADGADVGLVDT